MMVVPLVSASQEEDFMFALALLAHNSDLQQEQDTELVDVNDAFMNRLVRILDFNLKEMTDLLFPSGILYDGVYEGNKITVSKGI